MADEILIKLQGQDDISPLLEEIATRLDDVASAMDATGAIGEKLGATLTDAMTAAADALRSTGAIAGVSADSLNILGDAYARIGANANATGVDVLSSALDMQATLAALGADAGNLANAFGMTDDGLKNIAAEFPLLGAAIQEVGKDMLDASGMTSSLMDNFTALAGRAQEDRVALQEAAVEAANFSAKGMTSKEAAAAWAETLGNLRQQLANVTTQALADVGAIDKLNASLTGAEQNSTAIVGGLDNARSTMEDVAIATNDLGAALDKGTSQMRLTADMVRTLDQILGDMLIPTEEESAMAFDMMAAHMKDGSLAAQASLTNITDALDRVKVAVGDNTVGFELYRAALASGSTDLQVTYAAMNSLANQAAALRLEITRTSDSLVNLSSAAGDGVIAMAAADAKYAASVGITQQMARAYVDATTALSDLAAKLYETKDALGILSDAEKAALEPLMTLEQKFSTLAVSAVGPIVDVTAKIKGLTEALSSNLFQAGLTVDEYDKWIAALQAGDGPLLALENEVAQLGRQFDLYAAALQQASKDNIDFNTAAGQAAAESASLSAAMASVIGVSQTMAADFVTVAERLDLATAALVDFKANLGGADAELDATAMAADRAAVGMDTLRTGEAGAAAESMSMRGVAGGLVDGLAGLGMNLLMVGGMFAGTAMSALKSGIAFQQQMAIVRNLASNAVDASYGIDKMSQALIANANSWGQTPDQLAQGLYYIMSAGFHGADAMNILKYAAYGASGGLGTMKDVASAVTTLLVDYGLKGKDAATATGLLTDAVISGKTTIEDLSKNLGKVAPTAALAKYSMVDMLATLDVMTRSGISAAQSTTFLRATMQNLGMKAVTVSEQAAKMGISIDAAKLTMMSMHDTGHALADQLKYIIQQSDATATAMGLHGAAKIAFMNNAFMKLTGGIRSGTGAMAISTDQFQRFNQTLDQFNAMSGNDPAKLIEQHFQAMTQTITHTELAVKGSLAALGSQFVITFGPSIANLLQSFANALDKVTSFIQNHGAQSAGIIKVLGGALAALGGASIGALILKFSGLEGAFRDIGHGAQAVRTIFGDFGTVAMNMRTHLLMVGEGGSGVLGMFQRLAFGGANVGTQLTSHVIGVVGQLGGVLRHPVAAARALSDGFFALRLQGSIMGAAIRTVATDGIRTLGAHIFNLGAVMGNPILLFDALRGGVLRLGGSLLGMLPNLGALAMSFGSVALPILLIVGAIAIVVIAFISFRSQITQVFNSLKGSILPIITDIKLTFLQFVHQIEAEWQTLAPRIMPAMSKLIAAFKNMGPTITIVGNIIKLVISIILGLLGGLVAGFLNALPNIIQVFTGIVNVVSGVGKLIMAIIHGQWGSIPGILGGIFGGIRQIIAGSLGTVVNFVMGMVQGIIEWINRLTGDALDPIMGFVNGVVQWFQHLFDVLVGHSIIPDLIKAIGMWLGKIGAFLAPIGKFVSGVVGFFQQLGKNPVKAVTDLVSHVGSSIVGLTKNIPIVGGYVKGVVSAFQGITHAGAVVGTAIHGVATTMATGLARGVSAAKTFGSQVIASASQTATRFVAAVRTIPNPVGVAFAAVNQLASGHVKQAAVTVINGAQQMATGMIRTAATIPGPVGSIFSQIQTGMNAKTTMAKAQVAVAFDQMKAQSLAHTAEMQAGVASHLAQEAAAVEREANHAKDAKTRAMLEMKAKALEAAAQMHAQVAAHAAQEAAEMQAKANAEKAQVVAAHDAMKGSVIASVASMATSAISNMARGMAGMISAAVSGVGNVMSNIGSLPGKITGALGGLAGQMAGIGRNIMSSLASAIAGGAGSVVGSIKNAVGGAISAAKGALGINSPSRVFHEIGAGTVEGMVNGLNANSHLVRNAAAGVFSAGNMPVSAPKLTPLHAGALAPLGGGAAAGAAAGGGQMTVTMNINGGMGDGFRMLSPTDRRRFAQDVARELSQATGLQGIQPMGYSGRGTI